MIKDRGKSTVFVSIDIETDGPTPGMFSMVDLGAVAYDEHGKKLSTFSGQLKPLPGAMQNVDTMIWWDKHQDVWNEIVSKARPPLVVIKEFNEWLKKLPGTPTAICWPASWDFAFVHYYLVRFTGASFLGHAALDIKSMVVVMTGQYTRYCGKRALPPEFVPENQHTHRGLDDAEEQGEIFFKVRDEMEKRRKASY